MTVGVRAWRAAAGALVVLILVATCLLLLPPYVENWKLQAYLNDLISDPRTPSLPADAVRADVVNKAASLGLPVHSDDVRVSRDGDAWRIQVLYIVHVEFALYSVDLHFRPTV